MHLFVNQLTVMDFSYLHANRGLLGESWQVDVELEGGLDDQGMVLDFGEVKRQVKKTIDQQFDHKLLVPRDAAGLHIEQNAARLTLDFTLASGEVIRHESPVDAVTLVPTSKITIHTMAQVIMQVLEPLLPAHVHSIIIRLYPEHTDDACYQYSHGLKRHAGNCQRIAHGHRSRIEIFHNGQRDTDQENIWAARLRDSYIGSQEDLVSENQQDGKDYLQFAYSANQGAFNLQLPRARCYLIDAESTVENIAQHILDRLLDTYPEDVFEVRAFEGIGKGAACSS
jgi:6-pyruvoyl-tetrahydropterin synthase